MRNAFGVFALLLLVVPPRICAAQQGPREVFAAHPVEVAQIKILLAQSQNVPVAKKALPANPRHPDLMTAVMYSDEGDVAKFIALGADLNQRVDGTTYLIAAITNNDLEMIKFLVGKGADVNKMDSRGLSPMVYAKSLRFLNAEIIRFLEQAGAADPFATRR